MERSFFISFDLFAWFTSWKLIVIRFILPITGICIQFPFAINSTITTDDYWLIAFTTWLFIFTFAINPSHTAPVNDPFLTQIIKSVLQHRHRPSFKVRLHPLPTFLMFIQQFDQQNIFLFRKLQVFDVVITLAAFLHLWEHVLHFHLLHAAFVDHVKGYLPPITSELLKQFTKHFSFLSIQWSVIIIIC